MAIQTINIGNVVNDGLGDDLRTAFQKVNANFTELESSLTVTGTNLGVTGSSVFAQKVDSQLQFRKLISGTKILIEEFDTSLKINSTQPDAFTRIDTNAGSVLATTNSQITVQGTENIDVTALGSVITVDTVLGVTDILTYQDFGPIGSTFDNSVQFNTANSNIDFGTITLPGRLNLDSGRIV